MAACMEGTVMLGINLMRHVSQTQKVNHCMFSLICGYDILEEWDFFVEGEEGKTTEGNMRGERKYQIFLFYVESSFK